MSDRSVPPEAPPEGPEQGDFETYETFSTRSDVIDRIDSNITNDPFPVASSTLDRGFRQRNKIAFGTGATKFLTTLILTMVGRAFTSVKLDRPGSHYFDLNAHAVDRVEMILLDSMGEKFTDILGRVIPEDREDRDALVEAIAKERSETYTIGNGRARDRDLGEASLARHPEDILPVFEMVTQSFTQDNQFFTFTGGGTGTSGHTVISEGFREEVFPPARQDGHTHELWLQTESTIGTQQVDSLSGMPPTTTTEQQQENLERAVEDLERGFTSWNIITQYDCVAVARAARAEQEHQEWIAQQNGGFDRPGWESLERSVRAEREVHRRCKPGAINDEQRVPALMHELLKTQPKDLEFVTPHGNLDPSDYEGFLWGENWIPSMVRAQTVSDLQGRHDEKPRPQTVESALGAAARLAPSMAMGPLPADNVNSVVTAAAMMDDQQIQETDLGFVEFHLADELGIRESDIESVGVRGLRPDDLPHAPNRLALFTLFGIEEVPEIFEPLTS